MHEQDTKRALLVTKLFSRWLKNDGELPTHEDLQDVVLTFHPDNSAQNAFLQELADLTAKPEMTLLDIQDKLKAAGYTPNFDLPYDKWERTVC
jgi:hypothetical protein